MRLSAVRIQRTMSQLEDQSTLVDVYPIPDDSPAIRQLNDLFGDHTFFLDNDGLHIVEPAEPKASVPAGKVVKLATWKDGEHKALTPQRPETTDIVVVLGGEEPEAEESGAPEADDDSA